MSLCKECISGKGEEAFWQSVDLTRVRSGVRHEGTPEGQSATKCAMTVVIIWKLTGLPRPDREDRRRRELCRDADGRLPKGQNRLVPHGRLWNPPHQQQGTPYFPFRTQRRC